MNETHTFAAVMAKGDGREVFKMAAVFKIHKTRTNQQPKINIITKPRPNPYPEPNHNLEML